VWDSGCRSEWEECRVKASFLTRPSPRYRLLESLLWRGSYWYLEDHLRRMRRSAAALGLPLDARELRRTARRLESTFGDHAARKVRILLDVDGALSSEAALIEEAVPPGQVVLLSSQRISPAQTLLYHKTTHRPWYASAGEAVRAGRCFDVIHAQQRVRPHSRPAVHPARALRPAAGSAARETARLRPLPGEGAARV